MKTASIESEFRKPALVFDADNITLTGRFVDELSAYRARKQWISVVNDFFLLEPKRDYEMSIIVTDEELFTLICTFRSACGRYAFWRLVNHQAPEAEARLYSPNLLNRSSARFLLGSMWPEGEKGPWIISGLDSPIEGSPKRLRVLALLKALVAHLRRWWRGSP